MTENWSRHGPVGLQFGLAGVAFLQLVFFVGSWIVDATFLGQRNKAASMDRDLITDS